MTANSSRTVLFKDKSTHTHSHDFPFFLAAFFFGGTSESLVTVSTSSIAGGTGPAVFMDADGQSWSDWSWPGSPAWDGPGWVKVMVARAGEWVGRNLGFFGDG